jgi:uncharacterized protein (DUF2252 family)
MIAVRAYRTWIARYASMRLLDVRYAAITARDIAEAFERSDMSRGRERAARRRGLESVFSRARGRDQLRAFASLTAVVGDRRVIVDDPPVVLHEAGTRDLNGLRDLLGSYRATVDEDRRDFLGRFHLVDAARKVVGVGSVGTRCSIVVLEGRDERDPLILQVKEAEPSVLEPYLAPSGHAHQGERVVVGQRVVQATPDPFLGWATDRQGRHFYVRQLWDMKGSADPTTMAPNGLRGYAALCGWSLARAHARSGDAVAIAAYLGTGDVFDGAVADFAEAYARQNALDHAAYVDGTRAGRIDAAQQP